jgi:NTP pyrophosphatase (non-canonical NTP hydrolase)
MTAEQDAAMDQIETLQSAIAEFADRRDWGRFHTPKNLAMALVAEAGELVAELQWLTPDESYAVMANPDRAAAVRDEVADVAIYLLRLVSVLGIDLDDAIRTKMAANEERFPQTT